jgi:hypothetical protein
MFAYNLYWKAERSMLLYPTNENVQEERERLFSEVKSNFDLNKGSFISSPGFLPLIHYILEKNIVVGDSINKPELIKFTEFRVKGKQLEQLVFLFSSLVEKKPLPIETLQRKHFLQIGLDYQLKTGIEHEGNQRHFDFV